MDILSSRYYCVVFSQNKKLPEIAISLNEDEFPVTTFSAFTGKKISGSSPKNTGEVVWEWKNKSKNILRVRFFQVYGNNNQLIPLKPDNFRSFLGSTKYALINNNLSKELIEGITKFINEFITNLIIRAFDNCPFCELKGKITIMQTQDSFESLKHYKVCRNCALDELSQELQIRGINVTPTVRSYLNRFLTQSTKLEKVLQLVSGKQSYGNDSKMLELFGEDLPEKPLELFPNLPKKVIGNLKRRGINNLLPTQYLALESGLLQGEDLLVVAETSAGKTLIGEIAAIKTILIDKKKVIYLVPLVALANTKYESFSKSYKEEGFNIGLRVGNERLLVVKKRKIHTISKNIYDKEIIIATYEGIDQILRSGHHLPNVGLIIIDEIQTLGEEERGPVLDGLIARLRLQKEKIQIIGLSATVGNPKNLAKSLLLKLVRYSGRPIPLEIHLLMVPSEDFKKDKIVEIINKEIELTSSKGFKGQTMVFTNSRRKTKEIRDFLLSQRIHVANYHSGLGYSLRKSIEEAFDNGELDAVVATYALGAGVDFPASTVIFESLSMGKEELIDHPNIYFQMQGRAGRLGKHDKGKAVLLATPFPPNSVSQMNEIDMALRLMKAKHQKVEPIYDLDTSATQILATMAYLEKSNEITIKKFFSYLIGSSGDLHENLLYLKKLHLIDWKDHEIEITKLGQAGALSFLTIEEMELVLDILEKRDFMEIAILLDPLENIHLTPKVVGYLERSLQTRVKTRLFNSNALDLVDKVSELVKKLDPKVMQILIKWFQDFFNCKCRDKPDCDCGKVNVNKKLLEYRLLGLSPNAIAKKLNNEYGLYIYPGDLLRWLESILYKLEGIEKIILALNHETEDIRIIIRAIQLGISPEEVQLEEKVILK
ncbi:MAG: DUF5814 domain-containing protein, partial [Candidatus Thorarchaeota archaeon]